jgi:F0F1-type ATP synthase assembly protein I
MDKGKLSNSADLLRLSTLGLTFVGCTFAGLFIGWLLNKYLHLGEWVIVVGLFFGIVTSYLVLIEDLKALNRDQRKPPTP